MGKVDHFLCFMENAASILIHFYGCIFLAPRPCLTSILDDGESEIFS